MISALDDIMAFSPKVFLDQVHSLYFADLLPASSCHPDSSSDSSVSSNALTNSQENTSPEQLNALILFDYAVMDEEAYSPTNNVSWEEQFEEHCKMPAAEAWPDDANFSVDHQPNNPYVDRAKDVQKLIEGVQLKLKTCDRWVIGVLKLFYAQRNTASRHGGQLPLA